MRCERRAVCACRLETLLVLVLIVPVTGFQLLPGLGRPFGLARCGLHAAVPRRGGGPVLEEGMRGERAHTPGKLGLAIMDPPNARDDAANREFELNRGRALDTLLADYPTIFSQACDLSIFHESILLRDSQGFSLEGIRSYKAFFSVVPTLVNMAFSRKEISAQLMDKYGIDKGRIKIRWRLDLYPRAVGASLRDIFGWFDTNGDGIISSEEYLDSQGRALHGQVTAKKKDQGSPIVVEGISAYTLNSKGLITKHEIEVTSPTDYPFLEALRELLPVQRRRVAVGGMGIPNCYSSSSNMLESSWVNGYSSSLAATRTFPRPPNDDDDKSAGMQGMQGMLTKLGGKDLAKKLKLPKRCEQDYDCNEGGYNWPLRCVDFVFAKICVDTDDQSGGGLGALNWGAQDLVREPIPVRVEDGWLN